jgi:PIN domain nuclease of toxin-antitoxin system
LRLLLDTHALLWWLTKDSFLSPIARRAIAHQYNTVMVSAASAWEIATKVRLGRLEAAADITGDFGTYLAHEQFEGLPVSIEHGIRAGSLPGSHKDPFDRMLIAQAQAESLTIVSNEKIFDGYGVRRIW